MMKLPHCAARLRLSKLFRYLSVLCVLKICLLGVLAVQNPEVSSPDKTISAEAALQEQLTSNTGTLPSAVAGDTHTAATIAEHAPKSAVPAVSLVAESTHTSSPDATATSAPVAQSTPKSKDSAPVTTQGNSSATGKPSTRLSAAAMLMALGMDKEAVDPAHGHKHMRPQGSAAVAAALAIAPRHSTAAQQKASVDPASEQKPTSAQNMTSAPATLIQTAQQNSNTRAEADKMPHPSPAVEGGQQTSSTPGQTLLRVLLSLPGVGENTSAHAAPPALPAPSVPTALGSSPFTPPEQAAVTGNAVTSGNMPSPPVDARPFNPAAPQGTIPPLQGDNGAQPGENPTTATSPLSSDRTAGVSAKPEGREAPGGNTLPPVLPQFRDNRSEPYSAGMRGPEDEAQDIARREQEVLMLKQQVDQRLQDLENAERRVQEMLHEARGVEESKIKRMIHMYSNMKPKVAAKALESMDERVAVRILSGLSPKQAGEILSYANPATSAKLTELMTRMQLPQ